MTQAPGDHVASLLAQLRRGDDAALDELVPLLYGELRELARRQRRRWKGAETLNTTALLHEAYLKLAGQPGYGWEDRSHFLHAAARAMRHVLINYAEQRNAKKRGGGRAAVRMDAVAEVLSDPRSTSGSELETLIALDRALDRLSEADDQSGKIVECRVFGGMTIRETALALGISPATVSRGWAAGQAWLRRELVGDAPAPG